MGGKEGNDRKARRDRQIRRRDMEHPEVPGARQQAGIVADNNKDKEGPEDREVFITELFSERAGEVVPQTAYNQLSDILQLPRDILHVSGCQNAEQRYDQDQDPHRHNRAADLQRSDGKQNIACLFHEFTSVSVQCSL